MGRETRTGKSCKVSSVSTRASLFPLQKLPCRFCPRTASGSHRTALFSLLISLRQPSTLAPRLLYIEPSTAPSLCARRGGIIPWSVRDRFPFCFRLSSWALIHAIAALLLARAVGLTTWMLDPARARFSVLGPHLQLESRPKIGHASTSVLLKLLRLSSQKTTPSRKKLSRNLISRIRADASDRNRSILSSNF